MSIIISSLRKSFNEKELFFIPSLTLDTGFTCLSGPSGCGKTTLGRILATLDKADSGQISGINGKSTVLFQESRLLPSLTAEKNIYAVCKSEEYKVKGKNMLLSLGFTDEDIKKYPSELSGGMIRRVAIVRAVIFAIESGGSFVLLDEPFTGLDNEIKAKTASLIKDTLNDKTVLVITHDESECDLLGGKNIEFSSFTA